MIIYSSVYGSGYIEMWRSALASLRWPRNYAVTRDAEWRVFSSDVDLATQMMEGFPNARIAGAPPQEAFLSALTEASDRKVPLLMAPPDLVWGDGTVPNLLAISRHGTSRGVAAAHIRVLPSISAEIDGRPRSNAELVRLAWAHMHPVFGLSNIGTLKTNSLHAGTSWEELSEGLYCATFHIPTVHLLTPERSDVEYFTEHVFSDWDHYFPVLLMRDGRHKLVGSSDAAFLCEITDPKGHNGSMVRLDITREKAEAYSYGRKPHCIVNANTSVIFRDGRC